MAELREQREALEPQEVLLVADSMTGQDAVRSAESFHREVDLTGIVLTKVDGDARGGAALSMRHVTGVPLKFLGTGEKPEDLEPFHPDRLVSRILGMGDVLSLIEKVESTVDREEAAEMQKKVLGGDLTLEDFLSQLRQIRKMGSLSSLLGLIPGASRLPMEELDENGVRHVEAILLSMTPGERRQPAILDGSRKRRIARGSGRTLAEVNRLLKQFAQMRKMMQKMGRGGKGMRGLRIPGF
jgi:signal recognition particle subunit SRP54